MKNADDLEKQLIAIADQEIPARLYKFFGRHGLNIVGDAQRALHRGGRGRFTGRLATSYGVEVAISPGQVEMRAGTNVEYAKFVEGYPQPPRRHFLPYRGHPAFATWARRVARVPARTLQKGGMMVGGPKSVRPHFIPSIKKNWPILESEVSKALDT